MTFNRWLQPFISTALAPGFDSTVRQSRTPSALTGATPGNSKQPAAHNQCRLQERRSELRSSLAMSGIREVGFGRDSIRLYAFARPGRCSSAATTSLSSTWWNSR
jgi:hypothetical protein